jgi:hypothetical protein
MSWNNKEEMYGIIVLGCIIDNINMTWKRLISPYKFMIYKCWSAKEHTACPAIQVCQVCKFIHFLIWAE